VGRVELTDRFAELVSRPPEQIPLDEAALLIAAHARPALNLEVELGRLDDLAADCAAPTLDALSLRLFGELGIAGDVVNYYDPRNSCLDQVVTRRRGMPITLSVLAIVIGERLGVALTGIGMPGHFLVRSVDDDAVFFDAFGGGVTLDKVRCIDMFHRLHGADVEFDSSYLDAVGPDLIVARMLGNLRRSYLACGDSAGMLWVLKLASLLPDSTPEDHADLASLQKSVGRFDEAATSYAVAASLAGGALGDEWAHAAERCRARLN